MSRRKPLKHGTLTGYHNYKCRCASCKAVWANYQRSRREAAEIEGICKRCFKFPPKPRRVHCEECILATSRPTPRKLDLSP